MILDDLNSDITKSIKCGDTFKRNCLNFIKSQILTQQKDNKRDLTDSEIQQILMSEKNKRYDTIISFEKAGRLDLKEQYMKEISYINTYLPQPISDFELQLEIDKLIVEYNATFKDRGIIIRTLKQDLGLRVNPKHLSEMVINTLSNK